MDTSEKIQKKTATRKSKKIIVDEDVNESTDQKISSDLESELKINVKNQKQKDSQSSSTKSSEMGVDVNSYQKLSLREQILIRPDMYMPSIDPYLEDENSKIKEMDHMFDDEKNMITLQKRTLAPAVDHLAIELFANAGDNVTRSIEAGINPGKIVIEVDDYWMSIYNEGMPIPIEINEKENMYAPELNLGNLLTGSNYVPGGKSSIAGKNGYGAKLTNIYSKEFTVEVGDKKNKKHYFQKWNDNMNIKTEPEIKPYDGQSFVRIRYHLDFERFGLECYPKEAYKIFKRLAVDMACAKKVPVFFNGQEFNIQNVEEYSKYYFNNGEKRVYYYEYEDGSTKYNKNLVPKYQICLLDTPGYGKVISFANGQMTRKGGIHVDGIYEALRDPILSFVDADLRKKLETKKANAKNAKNANAKNTKDTTKSIKAVKSTKLTEKEDKSDKLTKNTKADKGDAAKKDKAGDKDNAVKLTIKDVKPHISIIIFINGSEPKHEGQSKTELKKINGLATMKFLIPQTFFNPIAKWSLIDKLREILENKQDNKLKGSDGKRGKIISVNKYVRANFSKIQSKYHQCVLFLVEGDSAATYARRWRDQFPNGSDIYGILPLRGKILNAMTATKEQLSENKEYATLKRVLGLCENTDYTIDENFKQVRYGKIAILTDADDDGKHISGLALNLFYKRFPSLFQRNFFVMLRTPAVRLTKTTKKGTDMQVYYSNAQYKAETNGKVKKGYNMRYCKGLASSGPDDIVIDAKHPFWVNFIFDDLSNSSFNLVFNAQQRDARKQWLANWIRDTGIESIQNLNISKYLECEVIEYAVTNLYRSIPRLFDGLKDSQRKLLWAALKKFGYSKTWNLKDDIFKTAQMAAYTAEVADYHHGELSLSTTINNMTQNFVGANNLSYFHPMDEFGSRVRGGKDAGAPRYTHAKLNWWIPFIFKEEDAAIMVYNQNEGKDYEPIVFYPILPTILFNGCDGIATGWSTKTPKHHPKDVANKMLERLKSDVPIDMEIYPCYRGFTGRIEVYRSSVNELKQVRRTNEDQLEEALGNERENDEDEGVEKNNVDEINDFKEDMPAIDLPTNKRIVPVRYTTFGTFRTNGKNTIISELPIDRWTSDYEHWADLQVGKRCKDVNHDNSADRINITFNNFANPNHDTLKLKTTGKYTNMVLLTNERCPVDNQGKSTPVYPIRYACVSDIMELFYNQRLILYEKRRLHMIEQLSLQIRETQMKLDFITAIKKKEIIIEDRVDEELIAEMKEKGFDKALLDNSLRVLCRTNLDKLLEKIVDLKKEKAEMEKKAAKDIWIKDINDFVKEYDKHYPNEIINRGVLATETKVRSVVGVSKLVPKKATDIVNNGKDNNKDDNNDDDSANVDYSDIVNIDASQDTDYDD